MGKKTFDSFHPDPHPVGSSDGRCVGNRERPTFTIERDPVDGIPRLIQTGSVDIVTEIQLARDGTELLPALRRFGVDSVSQQARSDRLPDSAYIDLTDSPDSLIEAFSMLERAERSWLNLPADVRSYYGNDMKRLLDAAQRGALPDDLAKIFPESEVNTNA